ncbi:MAG: recombinase family protein [Planctomycetota bacterium]
MSTSSIGLGVAPSGNGRGPRLLGVTSRPSQAQPRNGRAIPNDAEQAVIADIRAWRAAGRTLERIAAALTDRGVPTKTGKSSEWTHQAVARILNRPQG